MESDRARHVSSSVLARIAQALMLDDEERASLFMLSVPDLSPLKLSSQTQAVLNAFASLRPVMRRLWSATTEEEALTIVCEDIYARVDQPVAVVTPVREALGQWTLPVILSSAADARRRTETLLGECVSVLGPEQIDDVMSYGLIAEPGEVAVRSERPYSQAIARPWRQALEQVRWPDLDVLFAQVRTRHGFFGQLAVMHADGRPYSETDRAILGTLASLTSLALN